jgi:glycosyltransferase involved in cell wall biosynthesis
MRKVLHVITGLQVGGAEMALLRLIVSSRCSEYRHSVITLTPEGRMRERFEKENVQLVSLDFKTAPVASFTRLVSIIRKDQPDIVQTWMYHADLIAGLAARLAGIPRVIWGVRTTDVQASGKPVITAMRRICAWVSVWMPALIVCAAEASRQAHVAVGYSAGRMRVIPNGFAFSKLEAALDDRNQLRAKCRFLEHHLVVGSVARFNPAKDQRTFVTAAGIVAAHLPDARFLMIGQDISLDNDELMVWITQTGYQDRFVLLGERTDVAACLAAMDVFCLSSRTEGFPNVLGEAMALGRPSVTTDVGDAAMLLGDTGRIVPKEDPARLAQALIQLSQLPQEQRADLGKRASERVRAEFGIDRTRASFEALYEEVIKTKRDAR